MDTSLAAASIGLAAQVIKAYQGLTVEDVSQLVEELNRANDDGSPEAGKLVLTPYNDKVVVGLYESGRSVSIEISREGKLEADVWSHAAIAAYYLPVAFEAALASGLGHDQHARIEAPELPGWLLSHMESVSLQK